MRVDEFIARFRVAVSDAAVPPFWSDKEIVGFLNEAVQEACERAKLIEDRTLAVALEAGQDAYNLPASAFEIKRISFRGRPLAETSVEELDFDAPGWESRAGLPRWFILEQASGALPPRVRLVPTPTVAESIRLTVYRGANQPLAVTSTSQEPEIPKRYHERLMDWAFHRAYLKQDAEVFDPNKAAQSLALFVQAFGERPDANVQRKHRDRRPPVVACHW